MGRATFVSPQLRVLREPRSQYSKNALKRAQPLLGIGTLASKLYQEKHDIQYLDCAIEGIDELTYFDEKTDLYGLPIDKTVELIEDFKPDMVGISCLMASQFPQAVEIGKKLRAKGYPTLIGGNYASLNPEKVLESGGFSTVVRGEADLCIVDILENSKNLPRIYDAGKVNSMDEIPYFNWDLVPLEKYWDKGFPQNPFPKDHRAITYESSRGCPEKCVFCSTKQYFGSKFRIKSPNRVIDELTIASNEYGIREVQFVDDSMAINLPRFVELCHGLKPLKLHMCNPSGIRFYEKDHGKLERVFETMADSGFYQMTFAIESANEHMVNVIMKKRLDLEWTRKTLEIARKYFKIHTFFIIGFPYETKEQIDETLAFAKEIDVDSYSISLAQPFPPTELWDWVTRENLLIDGYNEADMVFGKQVIKRDDNLDLEKIAEEALADLNKNKHRAATTMTLG